MGHNNSVTALDLDHKRQLIVSVDEKNVLLVHQLSELTLLQYIDLE